MSDRRDRCWLGHFRITVDEFYEGPVRVTRTRFTPICVDPDGWMVPDLDRDAYVVDYKEHESDFEDPDEDARDQWERSKKRHLDAAWGNFRSKVDLIEVLPE